MVSKFKRKAKGMGFNNKSKLNNSSWHSPSSYTSFQLDEERDEDYTTNAAVGHNIKNDGGGDDITSEREGEGLSIADEKANNGTTTEPDDTESMWRSVYDMIQKAATILPEQATAQKGLGVISAYADYKTKQARTAKKVAELAAVTEEANGSSSRVLRYLRDEVEVKKAKHDEHVTYSKLTKIWTTLSTSDREALGGLAEIEMELLHGIESSSLLSKLTSVSSMIMESLTKEECSLKEVPPAAVVSEGYGTTPYNDDTDEIDDILGPKPAQFGADVVAPNVVVPDVNSGGGGGAVSSGQVKEDIRGDDEDTAIKGEKIVKSKRSTTPTKPIESGKVNTIGRVRSTKVKRKNAKPSNVGAAPSDLIRVTLPKPMGIVFESKTDPHNPSKQRGVRISDMTLTGAAYLSGKLQVGDELLSINDKPMSRLTFDEIMDFIIAAEKRVNLLFRRPTTITVLSSHSIDEKVEEDYVGGNDDDAAAKRGKKIIKSKKSTTPKQPIESGKVKKIGRVRSKRAERVQAQSSFAERVTSFTRSGSCSHEEDIDLAVHSTKMSSNSEEEDDESCCLNPAEDHTSIAKDWTKLDDVNSHTSDRSNAFTCHLTLGEVFSCSKMLEVFSWIDCLYIFFGLSYASDEETEKGNTVTTAVEAEKQEDPAAIYKTACCNIFGVQIPSYTPPRRTDDATVNTHVSEKSLVVYSNTPGSIEVQRRNTDSTAIFLEDDTPALPARNYKKLYEDEILSQRNCLTNALIRCDDFLLTNFCFHKTDEKAIYESEFDEWIAYYADCEAFLDQDEDKLTGGGVFLKWLDGQEEDIKAGKRFNDYRVSIISFYG
jgi:hypothetical protein